MPHVGVIVAQKFEGLRLRQESRLGLSYPNAVTVVMRRGMFYKGEIERTQVVYNSIIGCGEASPWGNIDCLRDGLHVPTEDTRVRARKVPPIHKGRESYHLGKEGVIGLGSQVDSSINNINQCHGRPLAEFLRIIIIAGITLAEKPCQIDTHRAWTYRLDGFARQLLGDHGHGVDRPNAKETCVA